MDGDGNSFCSSSSFCSSAAGLYDVAFFADFIFCWRLFSARNRSSLLRNGRIDNFNGCFFGAGVVATGSSEPVKRITANYIK